MVAKRVTDVQLVEVIMPRELRERIDDFRVAQRLPSRVEAIRQLVEAGLEVAKEAPNKRRS
jgi:metal-responsive CopG/Arc/MetJ family transcriptional regulator